MRACRRTPRPSEPGACRVLLAALTILLTVTLASCGVPAVGPVRTVGPQEVPYDLLNHRPSTSSMKRDGQSTGGPAVYFTRKGLLVRIGLQPADTGADSELARVLEALSSGPTPGEQEAGIGTAIPAGLRITSAHVADGEVDIDLRGEIANPNVEQNALVAAQIVLTATSVNGVVSVSLRRDGQDVRPVLPGGELATGEVTAADYIDLLALRLNAPPPTRRPASPPAASSAPEASPAGPRRVP